MSEKIEYRELFHLSSTYLSKDDLLQLEKMLVEDSNSDRLEIKVSFDSTTITGKSFDELLVSHDYPASTDELSVDMKRWIDTEEYKGISCGVSLSLHHNYINCHIHSVDQTWFLGKKAQIEKFFKSRKPWYSLLNKSALAYPTIVMALVFYGATMLVKKQYIHMVLPIACSIILIIVTVLIYKQKLFPFVRIGLKETTKRNFGFSEWCALIGAISGFATLVQILSVLLK